jgi:homocitrate synthase NifV
LFGRERQLVLGKHSGRSAVINALRSLGLSHEECCVEKVLQKVREFSATRKRAVTVEELRQFHLEVTSATVESGMPGATAATLAARH